jgi:hypothetical protein
MFPQKREHPSVHMHLLQGEARADVPSRFSIFIVNTNTCSSPIHTHYCITQAIICSPIRLPFIPFGHFIKLVYYYLTICKINFISIRLTGKLDTVTDGRINNISLVIPNTVDFGKQFNFLHLQRYSKEMQSFVLDSSTSNIQFNCYE